MDLIQQYFIYKISPGTPSNIVAAKEYRMTEFNYCFQHNAALPFVNKIHVFLEDEADGAQLLTVLGENAHKIILTYIGRQAKYSDIIEYAQNKIADDKIVCIMNGDMILDPYMPMDLITRYVHGNNMFGLTRHEYNTENLRPHVCNLRDCRFVVNYTGSHDTFIMKTPLLKSIALDKIDFKQNLYGAENMFLKGLHDAGYSISNPCKQILTFHKHRGRIAFERYATIGSSHDFATAPVILDPNPPKKDCYVQLAGRLCNQLFQIAALLAHAMRNKYTPRISVTSLYTKNLYWDTWLSGVSRYIGDVPRDSPAIWEEMKHGFHYTPIPPESRILLGYFQSSKHFAEASGVIRHLFDLPKALKEEIQRERAEILTPEMCERAIVIHVRRGDYLTGPVNPTKHGFLTADYYRRGIAEVRSRIPGGNAAPLLVFSDDLVWCRAQDFFAGATFVDEPYDVKALWLMSRYQNYVMSNSSFSWWAVWLGAAARCVVVPDRWFGAPGPYDFEDIYEPDWIKISP